MLTRIYHKKDEQFNIEFFQDKECKQAFNFENVKNLYIELKEGDCTPIFKLSNKLWSLNIKANMFTPAWFLGLYDEAKLQTPLITLKDLENIDFSKYIPTDNVILFLSEDDVDKYTNNCKKRELNSQMDITEWFKIRDYKKITIFIESYTESEIKKTIDIAKKLKEKYGIEEVNVFALHCFVDLRPCYLPQISYLNGALTYHFFKVLTHIEQEQEDDFCFGGINTITTTNSTKIVCIQEDYYEHRPELKNKLNILDCYDIFNNWLQGE